LLGTADNQHTMGNNGMRAKPTGKLSDGARCKVIGGTHKGKSGTVRDIKTGKTGHVSITVVQSTGVRFKTLARNVVVQAKPA
jgi:ribosomal protein S4E